MRRERVEVGQHYVSLCGMTALAPRICSDPARTRRVSSESRGPSPSKRCDHNRIGRCSTTGVADAPGCLSVTLTAANLARSSGPKPNWMRQRNTMLVAMSWWRQTAATLAPGCSASITIASFSSSVKLRRFDRRSRGGSPGTEAVKTVSADRSLAALLTPLLIFGRALG